MIRLPSGDQDGAETPPFRSVRRVMPLPSAFITYRSYCFLLARLDRKAILPWSGTWVGEGVGVMVGVLDGRGVAVGRVVRVGRGVLVGRGVAVAATADRL